MRIAVLGTGVVGRTLATKLVAGGHEVVMGSRSADHAGARAWAESAGAGAAHGTFADAAAFGETVLNCTSGTASLEALDAAGAANISGKILIDVANPLDFSNGMPPTLTVCNSDSLAEQIQARFPEASVVKTLNTINCALMVAPRSVPGDHVVFVSGDDEGARARVKGWLGAWFGWRPAQVVDLGDIRTARGTEMLLPLWLSLWSVEGAPFFNFEIRRGKPGEEGVPGSVG